MFPPRGHRLEPAPPPSVSAMRPGPAAYPHPHPLTPTEHAAYERDGYHIARGMFAPAAVTEMAEAFTALASGGPVPGLSSLPPALTPGDPLAAWPRMLHPHAHPELPTHGVCMRWYLDPRIGAILRQLLGEEPIGTQSMFYFKPPGARGQDFHQDNFYLRVRPGTCIAAWMAVDPADQGNGGLRVVRGSHRLPTICPSQADLSRSMAVEHVDIPPGMEVVDPVLAPGDVLFFNGQVIHGSEPNRSSDRFRRSFICHYMPESATEIAKWYHLLQRFDGTRVERTLTTGGGPCGALESKAAH